jgi:hypothetical protein
MGFLTLLHTLSFSIHDILLSFTTRHDTTRHDTTRHDTTRHDTTRHDTTRHERHRRSRPAPASAVSVCLHFVTADARAATVVATHTCPFLLHHAHMTPLHALPFLDTGDRGLHQLVPYLCAFVAAEVARSLRCLRITTAVRSECSCDVHLCSLSCCSLGSASALVTFICVLCTLRAHISRSIRKFLFYSACVSRARY